jgi:osomolarity two-component system sensor histidine kinase SLN1
MRLKRLARSIRRFKMRIPIREQLALLILASALFGIAVISVATWVTNHAFVLNVRSTRLSLTASLKAAQLASNLDIMRTSAGFISTRVIIQAALSRYNQQGNNTEENWTRARADMASAVSGGGSIGQALILQSMVFPKSDTGVSVLNSTSSMWNHTLELPLRNADGSPVYLGDDGLGYPPALYPNLTYFTEDYNDTYRDAAVRANGIELRYDSPPLLLGPWQVNDSFSLVSLTMPIINNTSAVDVLGWLTVVMNARLISQVMKSTEGLGDTGQTLIVGPADGANLFTPGALSASSASAENVKYLLPPMANITDRRKKERDADIHKPFNASEYPAVQHALRMSTGADDMSGSLISTRNEYGDPVSVGYAIPRVDLVNWVVLVEQAKSEVWEPIDHLRDVLIACIFATAGFLAILAWPLAHFAVMPIRRLQAATLKSVEPPNSHPSRSSLESFGSMPHHDGPDGDDDDGDGGQVTVHEEVARKEGWNIISRWKTRHGDREARNRERKKRQFRIPGKVKQRKHFIRDELSDLTETFNEMSDELMMQYEKLEERVQQRTAELELSKKAAEAANESKTLFIANISHELKTPLNGIMGMCAVCMQEDDPTRLKRSLGIIYKSGDLLLNLLTDLLTFSKNQVGHHISLDEKEFRLRDISTQVGAIFHKQATEGQIDLRVEFEGVPEVIHKEEGTVSEPSDFGPQGAGRIKDMVLWGDTHRILQVVINLVSNSLKFTPVGGTVILKIRCLPALPDVVVSRRSSMQSRNSRPSRKRTSRHRDKGSEVTISAAHSDAGHAQLKDRQFVHLNERAPSPPPGRYLSFEFEVQDSGPGIEEKMLDKIFEPFVQADLGLSKKYGGTGLGLSICSQLAGLMHGAMSVRSTVGEGSTFTLKIPLRHIQTRADSNASSSIDLHDNIRRVLAVEDSDEKTPARHSRAHVEESHLDIKNQQQQEASGAATPTRSTDPQPRLVGLSQPFFATSQPLESPGSQSAAMQQITAQATDPSSISSGRIRVLVAEDNKTNQEVVLRMLKLEEIYDVTIARDGQEALDLVKESMHGTAAPFNLVLMDVQMPTMDGLQSTRLIREIGYRAPIVALTAFSEESNIRDCLDSGMNFFLSKPIRRPQLKKVLKDYCAPIAEEEEAEGLEDRRRSAGSAGTAGTVGSTSFMIDGSGGAPVASASSKAPGEANGKPVPASAGKFGLEVVDERPVSPFSSS